MNFFINATMPKQKSGIEHAQLKRLALFNAHEEPAMIVLRDWDPIAHLNTKLAGIPDKQVINMFDFFQGVRHVEWRHLKVVDLDFGLPNLRYERETDNERYLVMSNQGQLVARVNYDVADDERVRSVELFDGFNNLYRVDHYDVRGFVSLMQWYTPDNQIGTEEWVNVDGQTVLTSFNRKDVTGTYQKAGWLLADYRGKSYTFDTLTELTKFFFDCLNDEYWSDEHPNVFALDRAHLGDWGLLHLRRPAYTVLYLHNSHTADAQTPMDSMLNNHYEFSLNAINHYDAVVAATHKQTADVQARFKPTTPVFTIPVGVVSDELLHTKRVPVAERQFGKMVVFARIAWEKNLADLVRAVGVVHDEIPGVTLDLYGYADPSDDYKARREVEEAVKELGLEKVVTLKGYTTEVDQVENAAMMYGLTSRMEGFNLALLEAISHGLIAFTYDVNYGPNEIAQSGINGQVVPYGDYRGLAIEMMKVLRDPELAQKYSTGAYDSAERYSNANVWQAWQNLLDDADTKWRLVMQKEGK